MKLYKKSLGKNAKERPIQKIKISIDELPERKIPTTFKTPKDKRKYIDTIKRMVRSSPEYKEYIKFLKQNMDMSRCAVLKGLNTEGNKYSIEIHHEPFSMHSIITVIVDRRLAQNKSIDMFEVANECMELHYSGKIGLIPLSITMHELVHNDKIFIPLQHIYHSYDEFFSEYEPYFDQGAIERIQTKIQLSERTSDIISDCIDAEFIYVEVDGFKFPEIPAEWEHVLKMPGDDGFEG